MSATPATTIQPSAASESAPPNPSHHQPASASATSSTLPSSSHTPAATRSPSTSQSTSSLPPSMLPRSTAAASNAASAPLASSSSSGSSSSSSATPTPTNRATASATATDSNPRARRVTQHNPASRSRHASTPSSHIASPDASNPLPSLFGFDSLDANHSSASSATPPTWSVAPVAQPSHTYHTASPRSAPRARLHRSHLAESTNTPRFGSLSFYPNPTQSRHSSQSPSTVPSTAYPSTQPHHQHSHHSTNTSTPDPSLFQLSLPAPQPTFEETTTISFTWTIRDLHLLRDDVELTPVPSEAGRSVSAGGGKSDVWTNQPVFGHNKWKLELVRTTRPHPSAASAAQPVSEQHLHSHSDAQPSTITILSVYLTALVLDYTHANLQIPASIMIALRPVRAAPATNATQHAGYLWRHFYHYTFHKDADFFTCHDLPSVSHMLQDVHVARDDAIALTVQLGLGPGHTRVRSGVLDSAAVSPTPFQLDGHHLVPTAVLASLHGLLDDANTGDVRILVRERGILLPHPSDHHHHSEPAHIDSPLQPHPTQVVPYPVGSIWPPHNIHNHHAQTSASIHHHPDRIFVRDRILWAHASVLRSRSDYFHTMLASEFSEGISRQYGVHHCDERLGVALGRNVRTLRIPDADFVTVYWVLRYLYTHHIQFADSEDVRSTMLHTECMHTASVGCVASDEHDAGVLVDWTRLSQLNLDHIHHMDDIDDAPKPHSDTCYSEPSPLDPHPHPYSDPPPAPALSIFKLAHRYNLQHLSTLASHHIVATLTPHSAFAMLLATAMYVDLHTCIKTYVYHHWECVAHTREFERCCDEVSLGLWGGEAGKTVRMFVCGLVSPLRTASS